MKKITALCITITLILGLCACGQASVGQSSSSSNSTAPTWQEQYDLGLRYLSEGNYEEAIIAFTAAIEIDPKQAPAYVGRGGAYIGLGETEENLAAAKADYEKAIDLDETLAEAYLGLADVYIRQGDYDKALEILQQGLGKIGENQAISDKIAELEDGNISDSSGKTRRETTYDGAGVIKYYIDYTYNANGQIHTAASYDGSGVLTGFAECAYNDKGQILESYYMNHGSDMVTINPKSITLDSSGREIRSDWYWWNDGTLHQFCETDYDVNGNRTEWRVYNPDGMLNQRNSWEYNGKSIASKETTFHYYGGEIQNYSITVYDMNGNSVETTQYSADGKTTGKSEFQYNDKGVQTEWRIYDATGTLQSSIKYEYDEIGRRTKETRYNSSGNVESITEFS